MTTIEYDTNAITSVEGLSVNSSTHGIIHLAAQTSAPLTDGRVALYSDGEFAWTTPTGGAKFNTAGLTGARTYDLPNISDTIVTAEDARELKNKTLSSEFNSVDATRIQSEEIATIAPSLGDLLVYDGTVWRPNPLDAQAPLQYAAGTLTATIGATAGTLAAGDDARFSAPRVLHVKLIAGSGEFTSVAAALSSITDSAANRQYVVRISPGFYAEIAQVSVFT